MLVKLFLTTLETFCQVVNDAARLQLSDAGTFVRAGTQNRAVGWLANPPHELV